MLIRRRHRNAEIDENGAARRTDDVGGLDIAVNDVGVMDRRNRGGQVVGQGRDAAQRDRSRDEDFRERGPLDVFGDHKGLRRLGLRIDDVRDEGGAHGVHGARLALKTRTRCLRSRHRGMHGFEGDTHAAPIFGQPHRTRAARSEPADQPVAAQFLAFFHALRLPGPSPICGRPRGAAPASSPSSAGTRSPRIHDLSRTVHPRASVLTSLLVARAE